MINVGEDAYLRRRVNFRTLEYLGESERDDITFRMSFAFCCNLASFSGVTTGILNGCEKWLAVEEEKIK